MDEANERAWAALCHLGVLAGGLLPAGHLLVPTAIWLWYRKRSKLIDDNGVESINFQLSVTLYIFLLAAPLLLVSSKFRPAVIGLWCLLGLFVIVNVIRAGMAAQKGRAFRYPLALRPLKA